MFWLVDTYILFIGEALKVQTQSLFFVYFMFL